MAGHRYFRTRCPTLGLTELFPSLAWRREERSNGGGHACSSPPLLGPSVPLLSPSALQDLQRLQQALGWRCSSKKLPRSYAAQWGVGPSRQTPLGSARKAFQGSRVEVGGKLLAQHSGLVAHQPTKVGHLHFCNAS